MNKIKHLSWDSDFWKMRIGNVTIPENESVHDYLARCSSFDLVYIYCPPEAHKNELQKIGAEKYNTRVILQKSLSQEIIPSTPEIEEIRYLDDRILSLAYQSGWCSRFFKDPCLSWRARDMYDIWMNNFIKDEQCHTYVYRKNGMAAGMINCLIRHGKGEIGLFAVDAGYRGNGIGGALLRHIELFYLENAVKECIVITQQENSAAMHIYQKHGYQPFSAQDIWHYKPGR